MNEGQSSKRSTERHNRSNNDHYYHLVKKEILEF